MKMDIYINYRGTCEEAFRFYEKHLGGKVISMMKHGEAKGVPAPPGHEGKILHADLELGGATLMGADIPGAEPMRSAYVSLSLDSDAEAERVYELLSKDGEIFMKMHQTFFATRFAMLRDRFGTSWMLLKNK